MGVYACRTDVLDATYWAAAAAPTGGVAWWKPHCMLVVRDAPPLQREAKMDGALLL